MMARLVKLKHMISRPFVCSGGGPRVLRRHDDHDFDVDADADDGHDVDDDGACFRGEFLFCTKYCMCSYVHV